MAVTEEIDEQGIAHLVVEHPPVNAFTIADLHDLARRLRRYDTEPHVRAVVLRSRGRGFCGGGDVKEVQALPGFQGILGQAHGSLETSLAIAECAVPVIGAIHRYCIGVGVLLAGTCDVLVASRAATFVLAEADNGATSGAVQALGLLPAMRLRAAMFTCEPVDVAELARHGSVYRVVEEDDLVDTALGVARVIAAKSPRVIRGMKMALNGTAGRDLRRLYRQELSYTYELNMLGDAGAARATFVDGSRKGYLAPDPAAS